MGNSRSNFAETFSSTFNTKMFRSKAEEGSMAEGEGTQLEPMEHSKRKSRLKVKNRNRRRSVSVDVRGSRRHSTNFHEHLVKINLLRNIRDVYSGVDSSSNHLGEGSWGTVRLVRRRSNPRQKAAVKILKLSSNMKSSRIKELKSEISLLQTIDHPHIARLYETYEEEGVNLYLVMEHLSGGELFDRVISLGHFRESKAAEAVKQMAGAIQYLHSKGIVHRDLKLENFMYRTRGSDDLVLIDFGLSTKYDFLAGGSQGSNVSQSKSRGDLEARKKRRAKKYMNEMVGSSYYMAPEVMKRKYGQECDLWSLGVIAYMLLSGHPPFAGDTDEEIMRRVRKGKYHFNHSAFRRVSDSAKDFVERLLRFEPSERLSAKEAVAHQWLSDIHAKKIQRRSQRRGSFVDAEVVHNLKSFVNTNRFKKLALQAVAYSTSYEDIKHLQVLFEDIDQDQDGYITLEELGKALKDHPGVKPELVKKIFDAMDVDKTQKVHLNQFIAATMNRSLMDDERILREAFRKMDTKETGEISKQSLQELVGDKMTERQVDRLFEEFKKDEGNLSENENDPTIANNGLTQEQFIKAMRRVRVEDASGLISLPKGEESETDLSDDELGDIPI